MKNGSPQPPLLAFSGQREMPDQEALRNALRGELALMRESFGGRLTAFSGASTGVDLVFLRACVDLRIPFIALLPVPRPRLGEVFVDADERLMAEHLTGVALAQYVAPAADARVAVSQYLLEWADAFLFAWDETPGAEGSGQTAAEARDLGIPSRIINPASLEARWTFEPDRGRGARHGFGTRKELLEFFDARFG